MKPSGGGPVHLHRIEPGAVAARRLGFVHGGIGITEQAFAVGPVDGEEADSDTGGGE